LSLQWKDLIVGCNNESADLIRFGSADFTVFNIKFSRSSLTAKTKTNITGFYFLN